MSPVTLAKRIVVKIGSSLLTNQGAGLDRNVIADWVRQIAALRARGIEVLVVSSGAIAEGMKRLGWARRPHAVSELQAAAAVGQMGLVQMWESCFSELGLHTAQVLLTHEDLGDRKRYLNARTTLKSLVALGVVPIINENDTVVVEEIRFGDNDTLGALVTNLIEADALVILTDQQGRAAQDRGSAAAACSRKCSLPSARLAAARTRRSSGAANAMCSFASSPANRSARCSPRRPCPSPRASSGSPIT